LALEALERLRQLLATTLPSKKLRLSVEDAVGQLPLMLPPLLVVVVLVVEEETQADTPRPQAKAFSIKATLVGRVSAETTTPPTQEAVEAAQALPVEPGPMDQLAVLVERELRIPLRVLPLPTLEAAVGPLAQMPVVLAAPVEVALVAVLRLQTEQTEPRTRAVAVVGPITMELLVPAVLVL